MLINLNSTWDFGMPDWECSAKPNIFLEKVLYQCHNFKKKSIEKPWVANRKLNHQFSCGVIFGLSSFSVQIFYPPNPDCLCYELHIKNGQCVCANNIYVVKVSPARWVLGSAVGSAGRRPLVGELQLGRKIILPSHHQRSRPVCSSHLTMGSTVSGAL